MELRQLRYFVAVAEERHFGRAAKRLHMAQPPLSQHIRQLEDQLGVRLLDRTTRRVDLTVAGRELLERGRKLLTDVETLTADVFRMGAGVAGVLRVGFSGSATYGLMPGIVRHSREVLPGLSLTLQGEMLTPAMEAGLRGRVLDAAVLRTPAAAPDIDHRVLTREHLVVALPDSSPLATGRPVAVHELRDQPFICHPPESVVHRTVMELCRHAGFQPRIGQVAQETAAMLSFVAAGTGVAVVPQTACSFRLDAVVYAPLEGSPESELAIAWRRDDRSALLRGFVNLVMDVTGAGAGASSENLPGPTADR